MGSVRVLPPEVANRIAAGEVVERPASVVKELVENALDAGAGRISIEVLDGGRRLIRVRDDGSGMDREDISLSVERHATSKIRDETDLEALKTMGFRGEALPSIASVSRFSLTSRPQAEPAGHRLRVHYGLKRGIEPVGCPPGTEVEVEDLFLELPARRRFLKSRQTELAHISLIARSIAAANPDVEITLSSEEKTVFRAVGGRKGVEVLLPLLGEDIVARLVPIQASGTGVRITGFITPREHLLATGKGLSVFLNRRVIRCALVWKAVNEAIRGVLMKDVRPAGAIFIETDPGLVDVNVHPTKQEVKFHHQEDVFRAVFRAVRTALEGHCAPCVPGPSHQSLHAQPEIPQKGPPALFTSEPDPIPWGRHEGRPGHEPLLPSPPCPNPDSRPTPARLRAIGQIDDTYILADIGSGLLVIDQHAAHEAILFSRIERRLLDEGAVPAQPLLFPVIVEADPETVSRMDKKGKDLARFGFSVEPFGPGQVIVRQVPGFLDPARAEKVVREILDTQAEDPSAFFREVLARVACHSAVRAGMTLAPEEMETLVSELVEEGVTHCPHGRPVFRLVSREELDHWFGRA